MKQIGIKDQGGNTVFILADDVKISGDTCHLTKGKEYVGTMWLETYKNATIKEV